MGEYSNVKDYEVEVFRLDSEPLGDNYFALKFQFKKNWKELDKELAIEYFNELSALLYEKLCEATK